MNCRRSACPCRLIAQQQCRHREHLLVAEMTHLEPGEAERVLRFAAGFLGDGELVLDPTGWADITAISMASTFEVPVEVKGLGTAVNWSRWYDHQLIRDAIDTRIVACTAAEGPAALGAWWPQFVRPALEHAKRAGDARGTPPMRILTPRSVSDVNDLLQLGERREWPYRLVADRFVVVSYEEAIGLLADGSVLSPGAAWVLTLLLRGLPTWSQLWPLLASHRHQLPGCVATAFDTVHRERAR